MTRTSVTLLRAALVAVFLAPLAAPVPALAGPNESAFLERLVGNYRGKGQISGPEGGTVTCRLTIKPSGDRLNFNGRCALSGGSGSQSFSGRISFNDAKGVFESSSGGRTVAGKKSGSNLVFTTSMSDRRGKGSSTMTLSPGAVRVQFQLTDAKTGKSSKGSIPFSRV